MVQFAQHAPYCRAVIYVDVEDVPLRVTEYLGGAAPPEGPWAYVKEGQGRAGLSYGDRWFGEVLQEYERRTTREAVARNIWARKTSVDPAADTAA